MATSLNRTRQSNSESGSDVQQTTATKQSTQSRTGKSTSATQETNTNSKSSKQTSTATREQTGSRKTSTVRAGKTTQEQETTDDDSSTTTTEREARTQVTKKSATGTNQNAYEAVGLQISFSVPIVAGLDSAPST